jgi:uncharacterized protein (TIGR00369 family)
MVSVYVIVDFSPASADNGIAALYLQEVYRMSKRTRTIEWEDSQISSRDTKNISGMNYLCAIRDGSIAPPPAASLVGYHIVSVQAGEVVFGLTPSEYHYNPFSTVHGGILSTLLDTAMTAAVMTVMAPGKACSTLELKVNFIRPINSSTGPVTARATLIHTGKQIATVEGRLFDKNEKLYAHATSTCLIITL